MNRLHLIRELSKVMGYRSPPLLLQLLLHITQLKTDQRGTILNKTRQICAYTDDIVIIDRLRRRLVEIYKELNQKSDGMRLNVNTV